MEASQILTILGWVLSPVCASLVTYIVTQRKAEKAMKKGMMALLRQQLIDYHKDYVASGNPCPVRIKEQATIVHDAYAANGGNGTGTQLWKEIMEAHVE